MSRLRVRWYMWLVPLLALAAGYVTGAQSRSTPRNAATSVPGTPLTLEYPVHWRRASLPAALSDLGLEQAIVLAPGGDAIGGGLLAVGVAEEGDLLPRAVLARLAGTLLGEAISLGAPAFRYEELSVVGSDIHATAYSIPAGGDRYTLAMCFAPPGGAHTRSRCEEIVERSQTPAEGSEGLAELEPQPAYAKQLSATLNELQKVQAQAHAAMAGTPIAATVAYAATQLASAFAGAAATLEKLNPPAVADHAGSELQSTMLKAEIAYTALADAAEAGRNGGFALARTRVEEAEAGVHGALQGLELLGYRIG